MTAPDGLPAAPVRPPVSPPPLVPELDVRDLATALSFYVDLLGFRIVVRRTESRFAYLVHGDAALMVQESDGPGRRFRPAPLDVPFGRGVNFQLQVPDVDAVHARFVAASWDLVVPMEERWYRFEVETPGGRWSVAGPTEAGNRQFVVADPDGYLWRPYQDLSVRSAG